jgi:heme exporter protein B
MWLLSPSSSYFFLLTRVFSHWLSTGLIIALMSPALAVMLSLPLEAVGALVGSILLGSISLIFIGAIGAALTVGLKNSSILLTLIILPLYVPVLIVAVACVNAAVQQLPTASYFALLAAFMMLAVTLAPLAIYGGLKINLDAA